MTTEVISVLLDCQVDVGLSNAARLCKHASAASVAVPSGFTGHCRWIQQMTDTALTLADLNVATQALSHFPLVSQANIP